MALIYGLADMQSFYASCEVASRPEYASKRTQWEDGSDPALVVAGDPERRSGIILAATPAAKSKGITTAMRLGEALRLSPSLVVVRPRMRFYLEVSVRIQELMREMFPLQEQFSVDEGFFAFPYPADPFSDPLALAREFQNRVWEQFRIRCRVGLAPNKWLAKMANGRAKKVQGGVLWWREEDVPAVIRDLSVFDMWGLKKRAQTLHDEFRCETIGDVSRVPAGRLRQRFGVWGDVIHDWSCGVDHSSIHPDSYDASHKSYSHRTTLPRDFFDREDIAVVILELLDEVCRRVRKAGMKGRRIGLGLTYARFEGGFARARTLDRYEEESDALYPMVLQLLDRHWDGSGVRAVGVSLDELRPAGAIQLSLFEDPLKRQRVTHTVDVIRDRFGETAIFRASSLTKAGQLLDRSRKIGGHWE